MRRVYYFTGPEFGLDNLKKNQLKVSRFSKCNDPFELAAFNLKDPKLRKRHSEWLHHTDQASGLICFSRSWKNPVMWSHYGQDHTGLCYGFDVDEKNFCDVKYVSQRLFPDITADTFFEFVNKNKMEDVFSTKFIHWAYEEEVRLFVTFSELVRPDVNQFLEFGDLLNLKEVIVGPKSQYKVTDVETAIANRSVEVFRSRLAFTKFEVVRQKRRELW